MPPVVPCGEAPGDPGRQVFRRARPIVAHGQPRAPGIPAQGAASELIDARRAVAAAKRAGDLEAERAAHRAVDVAKQGLGERGPVWWSDGAPDRNRHVVRTTAL